jgi:hypothetical protein
MVFAVVIKTNFHKNVVKSIQQHKESQRASSSHLLKKMSEAFKWLHTFPLPLQKSGADPRLQKAHKEATLKH